MRRYHLLKVYAILAGMGLFVLGLVRIAPSPPSPINPTFPENLLHIGSGLLFVAGVLVSRTLEQLRGFVLGLGALLLLSKAIILPVRWADSGLFPHGVPLIGVVCLVVGVGSLLTTALVRPGTPPRRGPGERGGAARNGVSSLG